MVRALFFLQTSAPPATAAADAAGDLHFMNRFSRQIGAFGVEMMAKVGAWTGGAVRGWGQGKGGGEGGSG